MNLRRKKNPDSLYMLLDTMCNAFGGIILLAVLVVLLTNQEKSRSAAADSPELQARRLVLAQTDLTRSSQLESSLRAKSEDSRWKQQMDLLSTRSDLQAALQATRESMAQNEKELETASGADPAERLNFLNSQLADAQAKKLEAQNRLDAIQENLKRLEQRRDDMRHQVTAKVNELQRPLRLPKEHETDKSVEYVIVRYGRIYPCHNLDSSRNQTDITWTSDLDDDTAEPMPGKGMLPGAAGAYFRNLSGEDYVVFCVFEDSFPAFIQARTTAVACGVTYGWEPFRIAGGAVTFSTTGHTPKPQ